ncbi:hypothetical protein H0H81_002757 [Sphagnurus paluster]|uniref:Peptidase S8/S53 domain-containing protein n=1 Tax=Sphagnurus paluster TaxID=117069 RepID=A0A9P7GLR6_9AGAR|nr:hypothetical protein H0H81_002757 [Sphagnurus paluster]
MRFFTAVFAAITLAAPVFSSPAPLRTVEKFDGKTSGKYIVKLKEGVSKAKVLGQLKGASVTHDWKIVNGFAGALDDDALNALRASPYSASTTTFHAGPTPLGDSPASARLHGSLTRIPIFSALTYSYNYDDSAGAGVDIYIIDTGVSITHSQFGGRARWGATFGGYANADGNGHGTHVAGTAAGSQYGVAKGANIIAVKVLSDAGSGSVSDIVSGLNWVASSAAASGRPSIASLSLGGGASTALDNAVTSLVNRGIHVTVAAGNSNTDAGSTSPARAAGVVTVAASTINDARASFSNYGSVVDIFAPGQNVISSWIGSTVVSHKQYLRNFHGTMLAASNLEKKLDAESRVLQATPHVAGLIAYLIGKNGNSTPANIIATLKALSVKGILTGVPAGTVNYLAQNA